MSVANQYYLSRSKMLDFLSGLPSGPAVTLFIPPRLSPESFKELITNLDASSETIEEIYDVALASPNGAVIFWGAWNKYLVVPPFPLRGRAALDGFKTSHLQAVLTQDYTIGIVLIRLGSYGIGLFQGEKLVTGKVGTGLVHARHRQGGSSSHRFERHRDKQMEIFFNRVAEHVREQFELYVKSMDFMVYGGAWETVQLFIKYCPFLARLDRPVLPPLADTPEPRRAVLEKAIGRVYASKIYEFIE